MNVAWRNLTRDRGRVLVSAGGVGFAVLLILLLRSLYAGILDSSTRFVRGVEDHSDESVVWVAQKGTPGDFFHSVSLMPEERREEIQAVRGVVAAVPLLGRATEFTYRDHEADFFVLGVDPEAPIAAPATVERGARAPAEGEVILSRVVADDLGIGMGDTLDVAGLPLRVAGVTPEGAGFLSQFAWVHYDDAERLLQVEGVVNFFLVLAEGDATTVADRIETEVPGTLSMTTDEFADENTRDMEEGVLPIVYVLMFIGLAIGTLIIGLTVYAATMERRREYGVMKAIGFNNRKLITVVWQQAIAAGAIGFVVGVAATVALAALVARIEPLFTTTFTAYDVAFVAVAALVMSLLASLVPIRPVMRTDPAEVFRG
ncbi:MAG TPA: FtsX-like permease family protein [Acidimicrobiales bacterium]|nr:FtsX-like permease family protein [Acidimicrobiales bacterium]